MLCRACGHETHIINVRTSGIHKRRRRECLNCKHRFTTYETRVEDLDTLKKAVRTIDRTLPGG